jgi:hypothetical protein
LNCDSCLIYERVWMGIHILHMVVSIFPYSELWKEFEADRLLIGIRTGCCDARTDASWNSSFSIQ